ncbi:hypothetical protein NliqN6_3729 [Naganishia liquefaciens]|uniref:Pentatricopeptide repeat domain-containing protein n=1 Tax=Naganishia liquefaciens TaxID=104408 RepID=A0A8H3YGK9_9TREE|nr:hypothetical protein NliqN6_3729 [Naganishia liquefaciens]
MAMSVRLSRKVLRAIATAVIQTRDPAVLVELQEGLRALPMEAFLDRLTDIPLFVKRSQHDTVDALVLVWIKALLHARMPDLADQLYESATIRGYFCSDKLDIDAVVGPLVDLKEWALVLKWTQGRICSVGVHAMRMRAFSSLGTPQLAIADYEEHHRELQAESRTMTEGMKAYYLTRNFDRANAIQRELSRQGKTRGHLYIFGMIDVLQRLGYTPLLEKAILEDLQLIGASHHHVPLLNTLLKFRIKNCLSILPIMENYPTAGPSVDLQTANQPPILLDQCTLALILDDARHLTDLAHLSKMWQEILSGLPGNHISSNLLGALIRSLLRLNSSEDALQLLQDVQARKTSKWIDRPAVLHTTVFDNLIGYISRKQGFDAVIPIFDLMRSAGLHPGRKTISCLVDGLSQHLALKPRIQFDFHQNILRILSSKLWADGPEHDLQLGSPTALRNHQMQEEIDSLLGDQLEGNAPEWPNVFEWAHLAKQVKSAKSEGNAKSSKGFPLLKWTDTSSPAPDAIFAATLDKGFRLDISTCKAMLHMYLSRGHIDRAQEIMLLAWQRGITPSTEMWSTFVEGLETADQLESLNRRIQALSRNASPDGTVAMLAGGSRSSAALMPNQAMWTEIIRELVNRGAFRQACQVVKCALACALRTEDSPDVGLVSVSFEALVRARQTIKAAALLKDSPLGFGDKLRTARGASKSVLLKALRRARAWHLKHGEPDLVSDIDVFLKSMPRFPVAESSEAAKGKHVKRGGFTLGELKGLEEQIGRMFHRLWPDEKRRDEGRPRQHTL